MPEVLRRELLSWLLASPLVLRARPGRASVEPLSEPAATEDPLDPADPISILYSHRLAFENGLPHVTVRILEGQERFSFVPHGEVTLTTRRPRRTVRRAQAGGPWTARVVRSRPGRSVARVLVGEHLFDDPAGARTDAKFFRDRGFRPVLLSVGTVYGLAGRTVDTRRILVLLEADGSLQGAQALLAKLDGKFGLRPELHQEPIERATGLVEVLAPDGTVLAQSEGALAIDAQGDGGITVEQVEFQRGYADHGFEDRTYRGRIYAAVDAQGRLAAVNFLGLEALTKGVVPAEMFAQAPPEALRCQAIAARGDMLAKVGARHVGDPYLFCAEQHCQVFRGVAGEDERSTRAVAATEGEALFAPHGGPLVPSYYSAICGGFTEDNDVVWGGVANPSLRGRRDFELSPTTRRFQDGIGDALIREWVSTDVPAYCRAPSGKNLARFRWSRTFTQAEVDAVALPFGIGAVERLEVEGRGISGRARSLAIHGTKGAARILGELAIRRAFGMLESGAFVVDPSGEGDTRRYLFRGAGWGHGAGMCQQGAIGRALAGQGHREILAHYFSGAEVVRMYG